MPRHKKRQPTSVRLHKQRLISRKPKMRKVAMVTRKEQPVGIALRGETKVLRTQKGTALFTQVLSLPRLERQPFELESVSSTWIADLGYEPRTRIATMVLLDGKIYHFQIPFRVWEGWYYAQSKGTYFNYVIKDKYPYRRIR